MFCARPKKSVPRHQKKRGVKNRTIFRENQNFNRRAPVIQCCKKNGFRRVFPDAANIGLREPIPKKVSLNIVQCRRFFCGPRWCGGSRTKLMHFFNERKVGGGACGASLRQCLSRGEIQVGRLMLFTMFQTATKITQ